MIEACKNANFFVMITARGSGEPASSHGGAGETMWDVYRSMYDEYKKNDRTLSLVTVIYPAQPVYSLPFVVAGQNAFFSSIGTGVAYTKSLINDFRTRPECADKVLTLSGYSQGAMVMHRVLNDLGGDLGMPGDRDAGEVFLVADGDRVGGNDPEYDYGTAANGAKGIGQQFPALSGSRPGKVNIRQVCNAGDIVCAPPSVSVPFPCNRISFCSIPFRAARLAVGIGTHLGYKGSALLDRAARDLPI